MFMNLTKSHIRVLFTAICLIISHLAFSQGERKYISFSGYVIDQKTQEPLPGAYIIITNAGKAVTSDAKGYFSANVFPSDSIVFSYLSYKKQFHKIPKDVELTYSAVIGLQQDAKMLREVKVYPYRTEEEFKEALVAMKVPDEREREILAQTFNSNKVRALMFSQGMGGDANYRYAMNLQQNTFQNIGTVTVNPLLNPFAWASFISGIKKGAFKDKTWRTAAGEAPNPTITRDEFYRNATTLSSGKN
jgi:CarboxypepD_reg-like domain